MTTKQRYIDRCELGAQALEANEVKARNCMYNPVTGGRCCLCVLLDVAVEALREAFRIAQLSGARQCTQAASELIQVVRTQQVSTHGGRGHIRRQERCVRSQQPCRHWRGFQDAAHKAH